MERVGATKPIDLLLLLRLGDQYGMIWNSGEYGCGGGRGIRTLGTLSRTAH